MVDDYQDRTKQADSSLAKRNAREADMADQTDIYKRFKHSAQMEDVLHPTHHGVLNPVEHPLRRCERGMALSPKIFKPRIKNVERKETVGLGDSVREQVCEDMMMEAWNPRTSGSKADSRRTCVETMLGIVGVMYYGSHLA